MEQSRGDGGAQADQARGDEHTHERGGGHHKRRQPDADETPEQLCAVDEAEVSYGVALAEIVGHQARQQRVERTAGQPAQRRENHEGCGLMNRGRIHQAQMRARASSSAALNVSRRPNRSEI